MVLESRDDHSSGMLSTTASKAIQPDNSAVDEKGHFLWIKSNVKPQSPPPPRPANPYLNLKQ